MEKLTFDSQLERLYRKFSYLWKEYDFKVTYLTNSNEMYIHGFIVGLENYLCKLVFEKDPDPREHLIRNYIGKKSLHFAPPNLDYYARDGWYHVSGLIFWLTGTLYVRHKDVDLDIASQQLKLHMEDLLDLYRSPEAFEGEMEYYRNMHRGSQITVDRLKEERARLSVLGQDWSLEAALAGLHGDGNEQSRY